MGSLGMCAVYTLYSRMAADVRFGRKQVRGDEVQIRQGVSQAQVEGLGAVPAQPRRQVSTHTSLLTTSSRSTHLNDSCSSGLVPPPYQRIRLRRPLYLHPWRRMAS